MLKDTMPDRKALLYAGRLLASDSADIELTEALDDIIQEDRIDNLLDKAYNLNRDLVGSRQFEDGTEEPYEVAIRKILCLVLKV